MSFLGPVQRRPAAAMNFIMFNYCDLSCRPIAAHSGHEGLGWMRFKSLGTWIHGNINDGTVLDRLELAAAAEEGLKALMQ